ncbi:MAG: DNA-protecting protein DprA [Bacteroidetes bacterium]|nr:MAG: DNA-protecting protein DprA [Bacteroidota bacterium]
MNTGSLIYNIGITLLPGVGSITAKNLIAYCGSAETVFSEKRSRLEKIPGIGTIAADTITNSAVQKDALVRAEEEIRFIEKENITPLFFTDEPFPKRLKECADSPVMLYTKGAMNPADYRSLHMPPISNGMNLNAERIVSIVGSRKSTSYGKKICEQLVDALASYNVLILSGMAYGIDICAHRASLKNNLPTVGVLAHGLDNLYPAEHYNTAEKMLENGGLVSEFMSHTKMNPEYFPRRNRIVAGMADATLVIEATVKSGALITAEIANSYDRDVFAVPGRLDDPSSEGCNLLIKANKAMLMQSADDVIRVMNWDMESKKSKQRQQVLFEHLSPEEETLVNILKQKEKAHVDDISHASGLAMGRTAALLLNLEFSGVIKSLPGKVYMLNN